MHFHKFPFVANFEFARQPRRNILRTGRGELTLQARCVPQGVMHWQVRGPGWNEEPEDTTFWPAPTGTEVARGHCVKNTFQLTDAAGRELLRSAPGRFFGQCGEASMFEFVKEKGDRFYGMGEKWSGFEHSDKTAKFWNTDVWADFHPESFTHGRPAPDPVYVAIPYLILKRRNCFIGLLLDNSHASFISTGFKTSIAEQMEVVPEGEEFAEALIRSEAKTSAAGRIRLGAETGQPNLYILVGPSLAELTRKFQMLVGVTPRPPAWALGYHQCRWGYESEKDLTALDEAFRRHEIPADGLWLDIDYMRGYRVFTFDESHFPHPAQALAKLGHDGRKVIPIIDPGVKREPGYDVYERGRAAEAFCLNSQGKEFVGLVWPGRTVFPDFSLASARQWWSSEVAEFVRNSGVPGAWLDMNDPSTGPVDNAEMRFDRGKRDHAYYHNRYALGMAQATRDGFLQARPGERPFLLCRSGSTGSQRYTAIWTGDNFSNYHHLKSGIATTLNLALSGVVFNGPDAGGFGGDASPQLMNDWFKAGFLFPVFRNHSMKDTHLQEPWAFGPAIMKILRKFIRLRYRLRPYLYQLFAAHEREGDAILRPLFYDFRGTRSLPLDFVDDQFLVGSSLLQAPFVEEGQTRRKVVLPGKSTSWLDTESGRWVSGGQTIQATAHRSSTPLYVRDKSILPLARLHPSSQRFEGGRVDFHVFLSKNGTVHLRYEFDDGHSLGYQSGQSSEVVIRAIRRGPRMEIDWQQKTDHAGQGEFTFSTMPDIVAFSINGAPALPCRSQGVALQNLRMRTWRAPS